MAQINSQMATYYDLATDEGVYVASVYDRNRCCRWSIQKASSSYLSMARKVTWPSKLTIDVRSNVGDRLMSS